MGASVVAGVDAPPVLEPAEHVLDLVAPAVERGVVRDRNLAVHFGKGSAEPVGVVEIIFAALSEHLWSLPALARRQNTRAGRRTLTGTLWNLSGKHGRRPLG